MLAMPRQRPGHRAVGVFRLLIGWKLLLSCSLLAADRDTSAGPTPGASRAAWIQAGIDEDLLAGDRQGQPWDTPDTELALRLFPRFPRLPTPLGTQTLETEGAWEAVLRDPAGQLGAWIELQGTVIEMRTMSLAAEVRRRAERDQVFLVALSPAKSTNRMTVCVPAVPEIWLRADPTGQSVRVRGTFLRLGPPTDGHPHALMVAPRIRWFPAKVLPELGVTAAQHQLASARFDLGWLDTMRRVNRSPLSAEEQEPFFELFAAANRLSPPTTPAALGQHPLDVPELLQRPQVAQGEFFRFQGVARRIVRILVDDPAAVAALGQGHYYQLDVLVPLDRRAIRMTSSDESTQSSPIFEGTFPITVCVTQLGAGLIEGENLRKNVAGVAVFYKLWSYPSELMARHQRHGQQVGPLLVGGWIERTPDDTVSTGFGAGLAVLVVSSLVALGWGLFRQPRRMSVLAVAPGSEASLGEEAAPPLVDGSLPDRPDFSNLP